MPLTVGDHLGHHDVTALCGEAGIGQSFRSRGERELDRRTWLKMVTALAVSAGVACNGPTNWWRGRPSLTGSARGQSR